MARVTSRQDRSYARIANEIAKKYGTVINLKKSPSVIIEIIRNYKHLFGADDDGGGGGGGMGGGTDSSIAVAGPPPEPPEGNNGDPLSTRAILKAILAVQRDVKALSKVVNRLGK